MRYTYEVDGHCVIVVRWSGSRPVVVTCGVVPGLQVAAAVEHAATEVSELRVVTANEDERGVSEGQLAKRPASGDRRTHPGTCAHTHTHTHTESAVLTCC